MKTVLILFLLAGTMTSSRAADSDLAPVFQDAQRQFTGVAVSKTGRMFVNYPRWIDPHQYDVVEVSSNGEVQPFPDAAWNSWQRGERGTNKWVCVQAVYVDDADNLWVVDPAAPGMKTVYRQSEKLVKINLKTDRVEAIYGFGGVVDRNSYLNDVRVDTGHHVAYLTESKEGGIIVIDLDSGKARQLLHKEASVRSDPSHHFMIDGRELKKDGKPFKGQSDGIGLSPDRQWLYYKPLTDTKLYRIKAEDLRDPTLSRSELNKRVQDLGSFTTTDGMIFDPRGNLYLSDSEHNAIVRLTPDLKMTTVARDPRLLWPDTFSLSPEGWLYVTCSQIPTMPWFNKGVNKRTTPFTIYKLKLPQ